MKMNNNKKLLTIIAVILVCILGVLATQAYKKDRSPETIGESINEIFDSAHDEVKEFKEEVQDEIDDHTTDKR